MAAFSGLGGLGGKRALLSPQRAPASPSSSEDEDLQLGLVRGFGLRNDAGGSSSKRRRCGLLGMEPAPSAACQSRCNPSGGPFFDFAFQNPLFEDEDEEEELGYSYQEEQQAEAARQQQQQQQLGGDGGRFWKAGSHGVRDENTPPKPATDSEPEDEFAEFTPAGAPACQLSGFLTELGSTPVLCALNALERRNLHPVGAGDYASLEVTVAGMLVLCRRACMGADEMSPDLLLTCLWQLMSTGSQYRSGLSYNASLFLDLHPDARAMLKPLKRSMVELQMQVLQRCSWRVLLLDDRELDAALLDLNRSPAFHSICEYLSRCAHWGFLPMGTHGHSEEAAASVAAYLASPEGSAAAAHAAQAGAGAGAAPAAPAAAAATARARRCSGSSRSSQSHSQSGLDGRYWQQPAMPSSSGRRSGRQMRGVLAPHNHS